MNFLSITLSDCDRSSPIWQLLKELETISQLEIAAFSTLTVKGFLEQSLYPEGYLKKKITKVDLDAADPWNQFYLRKPIRKLTGTPIYEMCGELIRLRVPGCHVEMFEHKTLYVFLNEFADLRKKPKIPQARRPLWS